MNWPELVVGAVSGLLFGLIGNYLWDRRFQLVGRHLPGSRLPTDVLDFDPRRVGLYVVNQWSVSRPLHRQNLVVSHLPPPEIHPMLEDLPRWAELQSHHSRTATGVVCYPVSCAIDHHESQAGSRFKIDFVQAEYADYLATRDLMNMRGPDFGTAARLLDAGDFSGLWQRHTPTTTKINVAVVDAHDRVLAVRRSGAVDDKRGIWTLGPNETMKPPVGAVPGDAGEDFFALAERCIREELGLEPTDYGDIFISWCGLYLPTLQFKVFAQVRTHLPAQELHERFGSAHSVFEADRFEWLPFEYETVKDLTQNWAQDNEGRQWSDSVPLAAQELWRVRSAIRAYSPAR